MTAIFSNKHEMKWESGHFLSSIHTWNCGRFANESFRQRLVRQRLRSIRQRPKRFRQRPTGQFANIRYPVLTKKKKQLIDVWNAIPILE